MRHPRAIPYLFLTEMWERFSYYGITAILILYMNHTFGVSTERVYAIYGAYGALVYMTPILGGYLADKCLGSVNAVVVGALFITLGHFLVAIKDAEFYFFYLGLAVIITGTGFFSPNINAIVGQLYESGDNRRAGGFTLAYMGRNIGTILAPLVCAYIAKVYGWRYAFVVAGFGMLVGLGIFLRGRIYYHKQSFHSELNKRSIAVILIALVGVSSLVMFLMEHTHFVGPLLLITTLVMLFVLLKHAIKSNKNERGAILLAMFLTLFYIVFMILLQQSGGALNLFTDGFVNREIFGVTIETGMFQSVEPLALVLLAPLYNRLWSFLSARDLHLSDGYKFGIGLLLMSISFVVMALSMYFVSSKGKVSMGWLNMVYILQASGELFIGPIGLAMISRLIPNRILGLYMGFWVLGAAIANYIAAQVGAYITPSLISSSSMLTKPLIANYTMAFGRLAAFGFMAALVLFISTSFLRKRLVS